MAKVITETEELIIVEDDGGFVSVLEKNPAPNLGSILGYGMDDEDD